MPNEVQAWVSEGRYKEGFFTQLATDELAKGINEEVVRAISAKRSEPEWMLEFASRPTVPGCRWKSRTG